LLLLLRPGKRRQALQLITIGYDGGYDGGDGGYEGDDDER
jgi:hypothetical protein